MSQEEEEILVNWAGRPGWRGGRLGGGLWGPSGGRLGARLGARLLPHDVHEIVLVLALPPDEALALAPCVLASLGEPADETRLADHKHELRVVGSGGLNLNPAVVTLQLVASTSASTTIRVRGVAKEGLIRQRRGARPRNVSLRACGRASRDPSR